MKNLKNLLLFIFFGLCLHTAIIAQNVDIPDKNFKYTLVNDKSVDTNADGIGDADADTNNDGEIQLSEAKAVVSLQIGGASCRERVLMPV